MINGNSINSAAINAAPEGGNIVDVRDTAVILGTHWIGQIVEVRDSAVAIGNAWAVPDIQFVRDTAVVTGDYVPPLIRWLTVTDAAVVTTTATVGRTTAPSIRDGLVGTDYTYQAVTRTENILDSAVITGDAAGLAPGVDVTDSVLGSDSTTIQVTARYTVRDVFRGADYATPTAGLSIRDSFVGTATDYPRRIARYVVRDTALITGIDANDLAQDLLVDVTETAVILGYSTDRLIARLDANEAAYITDRLISSQGLVGTDGLPMDTVWTASMFSWGMSRHSGVGITQRGVRFAVSPSGLYEIGATYSNAEIDTGFMALGSKALKHVSTMYLQGERDGEMSVSVTADRNGARATNSYVPIARAHGDSRTVRVDIGRGYRSTYYKLQVATTGRVELFGGGVLVANTQRRI